MTRSLRPALGLAVVIGLCIAPAAESAPGCAERALARPAQLSGRYLVGTTNPNLYRISFRVQGLSGCDGTGTRRISYYQEKRIVGAPKDSNEPFHNGDTGTFRTNGARTVAGVLRASRDCDKDSGYGDYDRRYKSVGRPVVRVTWTPGEGKPKARVHRGTERRLCTSA